MSQYRWREQKNASEKNKIDSNKKTRPRMNY